MRALLLGCLFLVGCAHTAPEPRIITRTVEVPVPVPCQVKLPTERPLPSEVSGLGGDIFDLSKLAAMDLKELRAQVGEWRAVAEACVG
jgi:hypothetical protein